MPLSPYLKIYPDRKESGYFICYSTKKGSVVRLSAAMLDAARHDRLAEEHCATLKRMEIVVDDPGAERSAMAGLVDQSNRRSNRYTATVVLTMDCNLACPYCYEEDFRRGQEMSRATADLVIEHAGKQIEQGRKVELRFYGGEPLLNIPLLRHIAEPLKKAADARGTVFSFSAVTNGTLLTRPLVESLLPLGFTSAQLTIDGPKELHDTQRPFVSGSGSFDIILKRIGEVHDLVQLKLGGNFTKETWRRFPEMLDAILTTGIDPQLLPPIQFAPVLPKSGPNASHDAGACVSGSEPWLPEAALFLREETLKRGFKVTKPTMQICMVECDNDVVINWDGSLYKCAAFMGWPELSIGTLADGIRDYSVSHNLSIWKNDECLDCSYLPICFGGCRLLPLLRNGVIDEVDCRRGFYDATLEEMLLQDRRYAGRTSA